jgi:hypothetical protein
VREQISLFLQEESESMKIEELKKSGKSLLGGLAGAAMLAGGSQAYGDIVVVTPPDDLPNLGEGTVNPGPGDFDPAPFDMNGDGTDDFGFNFRNIDSATFEWQANWFGIEAASGVVGYTGLFYDYADNLSAGTEIGPASTFFGEGGAPGTETQVFLGSEYFYAPYGGFGSIDSTVRGFIGVKFEAAGETHYGWLDIEAGEELGLIFYGAAYNSTPGEPIGAGEVPEPGSLALLALGAAALLRRR